MPVAPEFWVAGLSDQVARIRPSASLRAQCKAPTIQVELLPLAKMDEELVC